MHVELDHQKKKLMLGQTEMEELITMILGLNKNI